ncbi:hypothetical protein HYDPIDRAFT_177243 [Hydnomerulius pinastri MD-312]|uniref:NAD(P)-binding protein n=1 Tax=Hydnomerulius pinastri MD-312 TaxID=994086 RepID=A0A0C9V5S7_9AGAM|nr:hypothetical protein HYDPIDRAFT_177243 [Hydnomerulius pinastri MD-312]
MFWFFTALRHQIDGLWPQKTSFTVDQIPDMSGKVVIVTGGNSGLGKETVKALLMKNATVYIAARSPERAQSTIDELESVTGRKALYLKLNLANLREVNTAATEFLSKEQRLDILVNNAGVMLPLSDQLTEDGYDLEFGTNVMGHFAFTRKLLPLLIHTALTSPPGSVRIVNVASSMHAFTRTIDFASLTDGPARQSKRWVSLYCQSKFGLIVFAHELARRYGEKGIVAISVHPGTIDTKLHQHTRYIGDSVFTKAELGVLTQLYAAAGPEAADLGGKYLVPWACVGEPVPATQDPELGSRLWDWMEEQIKNL